MKTLHFAGDRHEYERRADSLIGRNVRVNGNWSLGVGRACTWRWWFDNHLRAEVLQVFISFPGDKCYHIDIDFIREAK